MDYRLSRKSRKRGRIPAAIATAALAAAAVTGCASGSAGTTNDNPGLLLINAGKFKGNITTPVAKPAGVLTDDAGKPFNIRTMTRNTVTLLYFGYTHCQNMCPLTMGNTATALEMLPEADQAKIKVIFVSVDPGRDTLARLRYWLGQFNPAFIGLRGSLPVVESMERQTGLPIGQEFKDGAGKYQINHATEMFAYSIDNLGHEAFFPSTPAASMAHDLALLVAGHHA